jgi:hypothetical protein
MSNWRRLTIAVVAVAAVGGLMPIVAGMTGGTPAVLTSVALPLVGVPATAMTSTATTTATGVSATATATATGVSATATATGTPVGLTADYTIEVGPGYTDVSPKALVRTTGNRLYIAVSTCDSYPCTDAAQELRMYRADSTGVPGGFTLVDQAHMPSGVSQWAVAIDGADTIHVVWNDRPSSGADVARLRYTTFSTTTGLWSASIETVDGSLGLSLDGGGQGVQSVALALDATGAPHVVYLSGSGPGRRVFYRSRGAAGWSAAAQLDDGVTYAGNQKAWHPNLAFDTAGRLLAVWQRGSFNGDNDGTIFARVRAAGAWGAAVNVSGTDTSRVIIDQSTSLLVTSDNRYHITWLAAVSDHIRYQYSDDEGRSWSTNNPGGGTQATHNPSLGYAAGKVRIYGHGTPDPAPDGHGEDLFFFEGAGGPAGWGNWTRFVTGTNYDSSVNVRWSQYFWNIPNTIDLAYWNDAYPNVLYAGSAIMAP